MAAFFSAPLVNAYLIAPKPLVDRKRLAMVVRDGRMHVHGNRAKEVEQSLGYCKLVSIHMDRFFVVKITPKFELAYYRAIMRSGSATYHMYESAMYLGQSSRSNTFILRCNRPRALQSSNFHKRKTFLVFVNFNVSNSELSNLAGAEHRLKRCILRVYPPASNVQSRRPSFT